MVNNVSRIVAHVIRRYAHGMLELAKQNIAEHGIETSIYIILRAQDL